ncbi:MAG: phytanoyl-CoA dioxygenase family protein [Pseudomonadota bacterium]
MAAYYDADTCVLAEFEALIDETLVPERVPHAAEITANVPIYNAGELELEGPGRRVLMAEWADVLRNGAGVVVLKGAYADTAAVEAATGIYEAIIAEERARSGGGGDHFAAAGKNDRIWNALQKLCLADPDVYAAYFTNPAIDAVCEAWLGPNYQMTAQVNVVRPGGAAQEAHRDYHLGFQTAEGAALYPAHVHDLTPALTLQGGIAHCDMPVESGPTKLLPFSQRYRPGYAAFRLAEFREVFEARYVQVPLVLGDAFFFNPALFHAAGANVSADIQRMANLLQVSSAFGRAMESVDRLGMCKRLYPVLRGRGEDAGLRALVAATAEGYAFPTSLDSDPPIGGLAPESQAQLFLRALAGDWAFEDFCAALDDQAARRQP